MDSNNVVSEVDDLNRVKNSANTKLATELFWLGVIKKENLITSREYYLIKEKIELRYRN